MMVLELKTGYKTFDTTYIWYKMHECRCHKNVVWYVDEGRIIWIIIIEEPGDESTHAIRNLFEELRRSTVTYTMS